MKNWFIIGAGAVVALVAFLRHTPTSDPAILQPTALRAHAVRAHRSVAPLLLVYVAGAVQHPGLYRLPAGSRANDAISRAGGFSAQADRAAINLAELVQDGEEIRALRVNEAISGSRRHPKPSSKRSRPAPALATIDVNSANALELSALPGIGPTLAARIVAYRAQNGRFASLDELADVAGMTQRRVDAVTPYLVIR
ncbi:MAG TPA: helix-hairpin-helix domain-containing protein [Candidatus Rubrimentiphilum sp.]|nr:helix-hairpin-helix domain-containing protein [Candidatus Rubrimentiphilum sp.]